MTAELIRRAATRLDELAGKATPGPWEPVENYPDAYVVCAHTTLDCFYVATENEEGDIREGDARWIALLGPQIAAPLAALLRDSAFLLEHDDDPDRHQSHIALARAILGETQ